MERQWKDNSPKWEDRKYNMQLPLLKNYLKIFTTLPSNNHNNNYWREKLHLEIARGIFLQVVMYLQFSFGLF